MFKLQGGKSKSGSSLEIRHQECFDWWSAIESIRKSDTLTGALTCCSQWSDEETSLPWARQTSQLSPSRQP